jgi:UDP-N-acetylglucosamine 4,6-dehydratase
LPKFDWANASILITGGTGSFGQRFVSIMLERYRPRRLAVLSRDEFKQYQMREKFGDGPSSSMRYFLGDVRDPARLKRAFQGVDLVIHAAALKQVPAAEADPFEAVLTNITGSKNVIDAAIDAGVKRVLALSTDKAANPANLYGATKLVAEKLFTQGNGYAGLEGTRFACTRYGNVIGSRGSVLPLFVKQREEGTLTVTDERMTRFWISLDEGVEFVISCVEEMTGGEIFVPKTPSMKITDLAAAIAPDCEIKIVGIRPGEKIHEVLISEEEAGHTLEFDGYYVIKPAFATWPLHDWPGGTPVSEGFRYASDSNPAEIDDETIASMIENL